MKRFLLALPLTLALGVAAAHADRDRCTTTRDQWQSVETLRQKLEAAGWEVRRVKVDDGCYEVYAVDAGGRRTEAYFDPHSLEQVVAEKDD